MLGRGLPGVGGSGSNVGTGLIRLGVNYSGMRTDTRKAMAEFRGEVRAGTVGLNNSAVGAQKLGQNLAGATKQASLLGTALKGVAVIGGAAIAGGLLMSIRAAMGYESAFAGVRKTVSATEAQFSALSDTLKRMSTEIPVTASALAGIGQAGGALGIPIANMEQFIKVVATLGATTNVSLDEAATSIGQLGNVLNLTVDDYNRFASTLVQLGNTGASTESDILEITRRLGAAGKLFGLTTKDILAIASSAANLGMQPELAASSLTRVVMRLNSISGATEMIQKEADQAGMSYASFLAIVEKGGAPLTALATKLGTPAKSLTAMVTGLQSLDTVANALGITTEQFQKLKETNPAAIFEGIFTSMNSMDSASRQMFIKQLLGPAATAGGGIGITQLMLGEADAVNRNLIPALGNARSAWEANNAAEKSASQRYATLSSQIQLLSNVINTLMIGVGESSLPMLKDLVGFLQEGVPKAAAALGKIWTEDLEKPLGAVWNSVMKLLSALGDLLFNWGDGGAGHGVGNTFNGIASALGAAAGAMSHFIDGITTLISHPVVNALAKLVVLLGALKLALGIGRSFAGMLGGLGRGAAGALGLGGLLPGGTAAAAAVDSAVVGQQAAADTQIAAAKMQMDAAVTQQARSFLPGRGVIPGSPGQNMGGPLSIMPSRYHWSPPPPTPPEYLPMNMGGPVGPFSPYASPYFRATPLPNSGELLAPGKGLVRTAWTGLTDGIKSGVGLLKSGASDLIGGAFSLISKAFLPLFIADMIASMVAAPIGDWIRQNTGMTRLADQWAKGWMEGLGATFQTAMEGTDQFVGRQSSYKLGGVNVPTAAIRDLTELAGMNPAFPGVRMTALEDATASGNAVDQYAAAQSLTEMLNEFASHPAPDVSSPDMQAWAAKIKSIGQGLGVITDAEAKVLDDFTVALNVRDVNALMHPEKAMAVFEKVRAALKGRFADILEQARKELAGAVSDAASEAGFDLPGYRLMGLSGPKLKQVGDLLQSGTPGGMSGQTLALLQKYGAQGILGPDTPLVAAHGATDAVEAAAQNLFAFAKDQTGLDEWRKQQQKQFGPLTATATGWMNEYGAGIEAADSTDAGRRKMLRKITGQTFGKGEEGQQQLDAAWAQLWQQFTETSNFLGFDQQKKLAGNVQGILSRALKDGMSLEEAQKDIPFTRLFDGIGDQQTDIANRIAHAVADALGKGLHNAKTDTAKQAMLDKWNNMMPTEYDITTGTLAEKIKTLSQRIISLFADQISAADTPDERKAVLAAINSMLPADGQVKWKDLVGKDGKLKITVATGGVTLTGDETGVNPFQAAAQQAIDEAHVDPTTAISNFSADWTAAVEGDTTLSEAGLTTFAKLSAMWPEKMATELANLKTKIEQGDLGVLPPPGIPILTADSKAIMDGIAAGITALSNDPNNPIATALNNALAAALRNLGGAGGGGGNAGNGTPPNHGPRRGTYNDGNSPSVAQRAANAASLAARAVAALPGRIAAGITPAVPALAYGAGAGEMSSPAMWQVPSMSRGGGEGAASPAPSSGVSRPIYVQHMSVTGPNDEAAILQQLSFIDPADGSY